MGTAASDDVCDRELSDVRSVTNASGVGCWAAAFYRPTCPSQRIRATLTPLDVRGGTVTIGVLQRRRLNRPAARMLAMALRFASIRALSLSESTQWERDDAAESTPLPGAFDLAEGSVGTLAKQRARRCSGDRSSSARPSVTKNSKSPGCVGRKATKGRSTSPICIRVAISSTNVASENTQQCVSRYASVVAALVANARAVSASGGGLL